MLTEKVVEVEDLEYFKRNYSFEAFESYYSLLRPGLKLKPGKATLSPFRDEKNPSFNVFLDERSGIYLFKDFADEAGDIIRFTEKAFALSFQDAVNKLYSDCNYQPISSKHSKESQRVGFKNFELTNERIDLNDRELAYFSQYGISPEILKRYNVHGIDGYKSTKMGQKPSELKLTDNEVAFAYVEPGWCKVYRPNERSYRFVHLGNKPAGFVFGFDQLPPKGDLIIITGGEKDVLSLTSHGYHAISLNSETTLPTKELIDELKARFKEIAVFYDIDETGVKSSERIAREFEINRIDLPKELFTNGGKDVSDFFRLQHNTEELDDIIFSAINAKQNTFFDKHDSFRIRMGMKIEMPDPVIKIGEATISTEESLTTISGGVKSGKSALCSVLLAGALVDESEHYDGFESVYIKPNVNNHAVIHVDTEQPLHKQFKNVKHAILDRVGLSTEPDFFLSYNIRHMNIREKIDFVKDLFEFAMERFGGIHIVVIDGIADFIHSVNDEIECNELVDNFEKLSIKYKAPILCILHLNPGTNKERGHLGSQLQRKSESVLVVTKAKEIVYCEPKVLRNADITDVPIIGYAYDKDKHRHCFTGYAEKDDYDIRNKIDYEGIAEEAFTKNPIPYNEAVANIERITGKANSTAKRYIAEMVSKGIITKNGKSYTLNQKQVTVEEADDIDESPLEMMKTEPENDSPFEPTDDIPF